MLLSRWYGLVKALCVDVYSRFLEMAAHLLLIVVSALAAAAVARGDARTTMLFSLDEPACFGLSVEGAGNVRPH